MKRDLIILEEDKAWASARIAELDAEIQALGPEFYDVFNQSSETWHDNAPFDALRDRQSVLDAERQQLRSLLRGSLPSTPKASQGVVGVGSRVELDSGEVYFIAGDWTPHAGKRLNGAMVMSSSSPLALALMMKEQGDTVVLGSKPLGVVSVIESNL